MTIPYDFGYLLHMIDTDEVGSIPRSVVPIPKVFNPFFKLFFTKLDEDLVSDAMKTFFISKSFSEINFPIDKPIANRPCFDKKPLCGNPLIPSVPKIILILSTS